MTGPMRACFRRSSPEEPSQPVNPIPQVHRHQWTWLLAERAAWAVSVVCLVAWAALALEGVTGARHELERFAVLQAAAPQQTATPDLSLWGRERISRLAAAH